MPVRSILTLVVAVAWLHAALPAGAAEAGLAIAGQVKHPQSLSVEDLKKQPAISVHSAFMTHAGQEEADYTGAALWPLLETAAPIDGPEKNANFRHTFTVVARDGYTVVFSWGELSPLYGNAAPLL